MLEVAAVLVIILAQKVMVELVAVVTQVGLMIELLMLDKQILVVVLVVEAVAVAVLMLVLLVVQELL
jgi:hypothetical protein